MSSLTRTSGVGMAIGAVASLSGVDALAKSLGAELSSFQVVFLRYMVSALFLCVFLRLIVRRWPRPGYLKAHALRGFLAAITASLFFFGIAGMPLLMALALAMTAPVFMAVLGVIVFRETPSSATTAAIVLAVFGAGLIVLMRGTGLAGPPVSPFAIAAGLLAPLAYALTAIAMKQSSAHDHPIALSLMQTVFAAVFSAPMAFILWQMPAAELGWQIGLIGLCGAVGFILLIAGLGRIPASLYAIIDYTGLVWAAFYGYVFFNEVPSVTTLIGAGLIVAACAISAHGQRSLS
ncbi:DMT family transporter [Martelella mediterranea]|uniref:Threonine/homoserine efflux transporter RhtA n=1 Tax=Martelella mediterranea TaxID=293089 RepID=A0A4V6P0A7_9HYPH|nr:DMT family transporter [Martelella mediterranea]TCT41032.1 threonine/homoserine efflux transporter RhtA [Martelella mediterranea]